MVECFGCGTTFGQYVQIASSNIKQVLPAVHSVPFIAECRIITGTEKVVIQIMFKVLGDGAVQVVGGKGNRVVAITGGLSCLRNVAVTGCIAGRLFYKIKIVNSA